MSARPTPPLVWLTEYTMLSKLSRAALKLVLELSEWVELETATTVMWFGRLGELMLLPCDAALLLGFG